MCSITSLPPEVLLEVFGYLSPDELFTNVQNVCKTWRELARHSSLWEDFVYCPDINTTLEEAISFIEKCPMLKHIHADIFARTSTFGLEELVSTVIDSCSDVRSLCVEFRLDCMTLRQIDALFEAFPKLEFFKIRIDSRNATEVMDRIGRCTELKKLIVNSEYYCDGLFKPIVDGCTSLEHLCIDDTKIPEEDHLYILQNMKDRLSYVKFSIGQPATQRVVDVLYSFTKLEDLTLTHTAHTGLVDFRPLAEIRTLKCVTFFSNAWEISQLDTIFDVLFINPYPMLQKLTVRIVSCQCDRPLMKDICQCYPNLKYLYLWYEPPDDMRDSFKELSGLGRLENLTYCASKTADEDTEYIARCRNLKHLNLEHCYGLTDKTVANLADCKSLESLNLSYCSISKQSLHLVSEHMKQLKLLKIYGIKAVLMDVLVFAEKMPTLDIYL